MMVIVLDVLEQVPAATIVHCKTLLPTARLVTADVADNELVMLAVPDTTDQVPKPLVGVLPANTVVGVKIHKVWFGPAADILGGTHVVVL